MYSLLLSHLPMLLEAGHDADEIAGTMTAVYSWYPSRFGAEDALRMGNYTLLGYVGANVALEFLYGGPHTLLSKMHLNNAHKTEVAGSNP